MFKTEVACVECGTNYTVHPFYDTVAKINQRSLPASKRCECQPHLQEITTEEFNYLVPDWKDQIAPGDPNEVLPE